LDKKIEQQQTEAEKKAFEEHKRLAKAQALINIATGITNVLASPSTKLDPTGILAGIQIASIVALGGSEVAAIDAQQFAKGGKVKRQNMAQQPNGDNVFAYISSR